MRLAPEGTPFVVGATVIGVLLAVLLVRVLSAPVTLGLLFGLAPAVFTAFFFRDPQRASAADPLAVLSPADGRITDITPVEDAAVGGRGRRIGIFLSVFNVHVQRAPTDGTVVSRSYTPGAFRAAWSTDIGTENENALLAVQSPGGPFLVRQIAGLIARRIVTDPSEGDRLRRGERIGLIRFGSRVELTVPEGWDVTCAPGDRVQAALSELARRPSGSPPEAA